MYLGLFTVTRIQPYIFASNRLRDNAAASYLVGLALDEWLSKAAGGPKNKVLVGGGNAAFLFDGKPKYEQTAAVWSKRVLENAPGLECVSVCVDIKTSGGNKQALLDGLKRLALESEGLPGGARLSALPVARTCPATGDAATYLDPTGEKNYVSSEVFVKRNSSDQAHSQLENGLLGEHALSKGFKFPKELNGLGGTAGESHIAVIHADGNDIGQLFRDVINQSEDADVFEKVAILSRDIANAANESMSSVVTLLSEKIEYLRDNGFRLPDEKIIPIRPIVWGGDDITFVCDARVGIFLAKEYLETFSANKVSVGNEERSLSACAGIAVVPTKYPFSRACELATELCSSAKSTRRKEIDADLRNRAWFDYQVEMESLSGNLQQIRKQQYSTSIDGLPLHARPYYLGAPKGFVDGSPWKAIEGVIESFNSKTATGEFAWSRTELKELQRALSRGAAETKRVIKRLEVKGGRGRKLKEITGHSNYHNEGWHDGRTVYFDALELRDFWIDLN